MISPDSLMTQPVQIILRTEDGPDDRYGNPTTGVTELDTLGFAEQRSTTEAGAEDQILNARWKLLLPAVTPISGWDGVKIEGRSYEVVGFPWYARNPRTGIVSHVEVDLETAA